MLVQVAVPVPSLDLLTYAVPNGSAVPPIGARVVVPLGSRVVTGIVIATGVTTPPDGALTNADVKPITDVLDVEPFVPADVVALARWTAKDHASGVGDAIPLLLPPMARGARADAHKTRRVASITAAGREAEAGATERQREALALLAGAPDGLATAELATRGIGPDTVSRLVC